MTPYQRDRLDSIVSEMADGETRLNPMPGIASVTRKDRWEVEYVIPDPQEEEARKFLASIADRSQ